MTAPAVNELADRLIGSISTHASRNALTLVGQNGDVTQMTYRDIGESLDSKREPSLAIVKPSAGLQTCLKVVDAITRGDALVLAPPAAGAPAQAHQVAPGSLTVFTSGAGQLPRGVVHTPSSVCAAIDRTSVFGVVDTQLTFLVPISVAHIGGVFVLLKALLAGDHVVFPASAHPRAIVQAMALGRAQIVGLPPPLARLVMRVRVPDDFDTTSVVMNLATMASTPQLIRVIEERWGCLVGVSYGSTELCGPVATALVTALSPPGYVGQPLPGVAVRVVDDEGNGCQAGAPGRLECLVNGNSFRYLDAHAAPSSGEGYWETRDSASLQTDGGLCVFGRADDMIVRDGNVFAPDEIEEQLRTMPGISDVAVIDLRASDELQGRLTAFVVAQSTKSMLSTTEVLGWSREHLQRSRCPDDVRFIDAIPRTANGKLRRSELRATT